MNKHVVLFVSEYPRSGKTTARDVLASALGCKGASCSDRIIEEVLATGAAPSKQDILDNKEAYRPRLIKTGDALCAKDSTILLRHAAWASPVIDGARRYQELERFKAECAGTRIPKGAENPVAGTNLVVVWVERKSHTTQKDNTTVTRDQADVVFRFGEITCLNKPWYKCKLWLCILIGTMRASHRTKTKS